MAEPARGTRRDAFDILGVAARFDLDLPAVQRAYLARSADVHPDRAGEAGEQLAAELNDAKRVLEDPERRAGALLARLGGPSKEADRSLPDGFLMEMMELRESAEAAGASGDRAEVDRWIADAERRRKGHIESVGRAFAAVGAAPTGDQLRAIRRELNAWRYIERMIEQLDGGGETM
ncbi:MAG: iron-sulfur cluster co-chaperone HscB C-terminal domain-containing protein [Phycisphaerales bacterium]